MELNRRKFFGVAAASPLAAKEIAERAIEEAQMQAASISTYNDAIYTGIPEPYTAPDMRSLWDAIKDLGVPEWKREDLWEDAKRCRSLDPDIATMKSLPLSGKMRMQWKRNYRALVDRAMRQTELARMKSAFFEAHPDVEEY